mmetsp:Transcript_41315/g.116954  ORF Transcript_41315/g.116954 Transcript_41315/m.116954 type:complete len:200 (+) Transcript_41315:1-600(+)
MMFICPAVAAYHHAQPCQRAPPWYQGPREGPAASSCKEAAVTPQSSCSSSTRLSSAATWSMTSEDAEPHPQAASVGNSHSASDAGDEVDARRVLWADVRDDDADEAGGGAGVPEASVAVGSDECPSLGSFGHPTSCGPACKYAKKARGCKDGASCSHCHLCKFAAHGRRGRNKLAQMKQQVPGTPIAESASQGCCRLAA